MPTQGGRAGANSATSRVRVLNRRAEEPDATAPKDTAVTGLGRGIRWTRGDEARDRGSCRSRDGPREDRRPGRPCRRGGDSGELRRGRVSQLAGERPAEARAQGADWGTAD